MGEIISLKEYQNRKQKNEKSEKTTEYYAYDENINEFLNYMNSEVTKILDRPGIEKIIEMEKEDRKNFEERYSDILLAAPHTSEDKLKYFANIMLNLLPSVFHGEQEDRFNTHMDFSEFYLSEFDAAYSQYYSANQQYEEKYPFQFDRLDATELENAMQNCLRQIINSEDKTEIMWQASRLFELYHFMAELF